MVEDILGRAQIVYNSEKSTEGEGNQEGFIRSVDVCTRDCSERMLALSVTAGDQCRARAPQGQPPMVGGLPEAATNPAQRVLQRQNCFRRRSRGRLFASLEDGDLHPGPDGKETNDAAEDVSNSQEFISSQSKPFSDSDSPKYGDPSTGREASANPSSSSEPSSYGDTQLSSIPDNTVERLAEMEQLKMQLLELTAGLNRGLAADDTEADLVGEAAMKLEQEQKRVALIESINNDELNALDGNWRLVYSSAFRTGNLGGNRPGPLYLPVPGTSISLGPIYQKINMQKRTLDNMVQINGLPPPRFPWQSDGSTWTLQLELMHDLELLGSAGIRIVNTAGSVKLLDSETEVAGLPFPPRPSFLQPLLGSINTGEFKVSFLDEDLYINKGDRGELRVFVRDD